MTYYSQLDSRWKNIEYTEGYTFGKFGCFVTSLAMITEIDPPEVARIIQPCFSNGLLNSECAAVRLGIEYEGKTTSFPDYDFVIAETDYYKNSGVPQHFFVIDRNGNQFDPLGRDIKYPIKSYRLFKKGVNMEKKIAFNILNHAWEVLHGGVVTNDAQKDSIRKEVDEIYPKWQQNEWAFNGKIDQWLKEGGLTNPCNCDSLLADANNKCQERINSYEEEQIDMMAEHQKFVETAEKKVNGLLSKIEKLEQRPCPPCKEIDKYGKWELLVLAIKKIFK